MTDKQLSILLKQYGERLEKIIEALENELPPELLQEATSPLFKLKSHFFPCTVELHAFKDELNKSAELLERESIPTS